MRISPIIKNNFINFKSKVTNVYQGKICDELAQKIDVFEETHANARELGNGLFARAYVLNGTNCVIKESLPDESAKKQNASFALEADALEMLPATVKNTQRLIARVRTEKGNPYLLSTLVVGAPASYPNNPWNKKSFDGLFKTLFSLDEAGIYHNDINQANCLIAPNNEVSVIDYQFAEKFNINKTRDNVDKFKTKSTMMPSNAQMFEMASFPWYIRKMSKTTPKGEVRNTFKTYLQAKSEYAKARAFYLLENNYPGKMRDYELLQAKFLENPTDEIIDLQAKKLHLMYSYRKTFSVIDANNNKDKNIGSAIQSYIYTIAVAKDMENYAKHLKTEAKDSDLKTFLQMEEDYAWFWRNMLTDELGLNKEDGVYSWLERNATLNLKHEYVIIDDYDINFGPYSYQEDIGPSEKENLGENFQNLENIPPKTIDDIAGMIINDTALGIKPEFNQTQKNKISDLAIKLENKISKNDDSLQPDIVDEDVLNYLNQKAKYIKSSKEVVELSKKENYNALISTALLAEYQKNIANVSYDKIKFRKDVGEDFINQQKEILNGHINLDILKESSNMLINYILNSNDENSLNDKEFLKFS